MLQGRFQHIIQKVIKDVISSNVILKLSNLGNDSLQEVNQKSLSRFNMSLGSLNNFLDSSINLFHNSLNLVQKISDIIFDFSRLNLGFDLVEDIFQILSSFHNVSDRDVLLWFELVGKITKMFSNSGNKVLNSMFDCGFQDIIQEIIKDIVTSNTVFQLSQFGQDLLKKLNKKTFTRFDAGLNIGLHLCGYIFNSSLDLFQSSFDSWFGSLNLGINNSFQVVEKINDVILHFSRLNLSFKLIENILDVLGNFHDIRNSNVFNISIWHKLANKITKMFLDGRDEVFNCFTKSRLQDIIEEIIKDVVPCQVVFQFSQFNHDLCQKLN